MNAQRVTDEQLVALLDVLDEAKVRLRRILAVVDDLPKRTEKEGIVGRLFGGLSGRRQAAEAAWRDEIRAAISVALDAQDVDALWGAVTKIHVEAEVILDTLADLDQAGSSLEN